jgi:hypothetical protein
LYVYDYGDNVVSAGDMVTVSGSYTEYYEFTELVTPTVTITGSADVPAPLLVAACDVGTGGVNQEAYESMLVRIEDVAVTNANPDDPNDYDEFEVNSCLRIDDYVYADLDQSALGTDYASITGVLMYGFSNSKIAPRDAADLVQ